MLVKFFKGKHNNPNHAIGYLLDKKRVEEGTAKLLNNFNTPAEIKLFYKNLDKSKFKNNIYTCGVISFSEEESKNLTDEQIQTIINEFLNTLNPSINHSNYLKMFVKHTDKNRAEIHFVIPNFVFDDEKLMKKTMYLDKIDRQKFYYFERYINNKFNLTDPLENTAPKKLSFQTYEKYKKEIENSKTKKEVKDKLHKLLLNKIKNNEIKNRDELLDFIKNVLNYEITRIGKDYISIKIPGHKKAIRFKNIIYSEKFKSKKDVVNEIKNIRNEISNDEKIEKKLIEILEKQTKQIKQKYSFIYSSEKEKEKMLYSVEKVEKNKNFNFERNDMNFKELTQFLKENLLIQDYLGIAENITNSPLRDDDFEPSFFITKYNTWIDYGTGERGDIFDLIKHLENTQDFKSTVLKAKQIFKDLYGYYPDENLNVNNIKKEIKKDVNFNSSEKKRKKIVSKSNLEIIEKSSNFNDFNLKNYFINERGIDEEILKNETKQLTIYNKKTGKTFTAIGFENNSGGYELRNKLFKGSLGKKDITTKNVNRDGIVLLEGFTDYLSLLTILKNKDFREQNTVFEEMYKKMEKIGFIILNSIVNLPKIVPFIKGKKIFTLLDNDEAGINTTNKLKNEYKDIADKITDLTPSILNNSNKDINDYLLTLKQKYNEIKNDKVKEIEKKYNYKFSINELELLQYDYFTNKVPEYKKIIKDYQPNFYNYLEAHLKQKQFEEQNNNNIILDTRTKLGM